MASACKVRPNSQIIYEKGLRAPRADYLLEAAKLGLDCVYIITGHRVPMVGVSLLDDEIELLHSVRVLRPIDRDALVHVIHRISRTPPQREQNSWT